MLFYSGLVFLVIAVSVDGFGVGITYGIRKIHVPLLAILIIMLCTGFIVLLSMTIGNLLTSFISSEHTRILGGSILIALGGASFVNVFRTKWDNGKSSCTPRQMEMEIPTFRNVIQTPTKADLDHSGIISAGEALLLGIALSLDAFGAGLGASMIGYSPILASLTISFTSALFLHSGIKIGLFLSKKRPFQKLTYIPPLLLITLGIVNVL